MRKTRRLFVLLLFAAVAAFGVLGFSGCRDEQSQEESQRLEYELDSFGEAYRVVGIGHCTDTEIVIPREHRDLPVKEIANGAFQNCTDITSVVIPDSITSIGSSAFTGCASLISVTLPDSIRKIDINAFDACYRLVEVYNQSPLNITVGSSEHGKVGYYAKAVHTQPYTSKVSIDENGYVLYTDNDTISLINYVGKETDLILPTSITDIHQGAFANCINLTSVKIPNGITTLKNWTFNFCSSLKNVSIPDSIILIEENTFNYCDNLFYYLQNGLKYLGNEGNRYLCLAKTNSDTISVAQINTNCRLIANYAFAHCDQLTEIVIPDSVISIGAKAIYDCRNLQSITLPNSLISIQSNTFAGCLRLNEIVIPDSVTFIGRFAFGSPSKLTSITFNGTIAQWNAIQKDDDWNYKVPATEVVCLDGVVAI